MSTEKKKTAFPARVIGIIVLLVVAAGAVGVYVNGMRSGNLPSEIADNADCSAAVTLASRLQDLAVGDIAAMTSIDTPTHLASLSFKGPDGNVMSLGNFGGKTVLVNLWATWCVPCRTEMPALDALQADMGSDAFEVVTINIDQGDDSKPKAFLKEIGVSDLAFYSDNSMGVFNTLKKQGNAVGLPATLLVDRNGCLISRMFGPAHWSGDDAKTYLKQALEANGQA
jgi:thiol-disulfide isomerase/thioredoxin